MAQWDATYESLPSGQTAFLDVPARLRSVLAEIRKRVNDFFSNWESDPDVETVVFAPQVLQAQNIAGLTGEGEVSLDSFPNGATSGKAGGVESGDIASLKSGCVFDGAVTIERSYTPIGRCTNWLEAYFTSKLILSHADEFYYLEVSLPQGAVVTKFRVTGYYTHPCSGLFYLKRGTIAGDSEGIMSTISAESAESAGFDVSDESIDYATIDNGTYKYWVKLARASGTIAVYNVMITCTTTDMRIY